MAPSCGLFLFGKYSKIVFQIDLTRFLILATSTTDNPCAKMQAAVLPIIAEYYIGVNLIVSECSAEFQALQNAGGPGFPQNVIDERIACVAGINNNNFDKVQFDITSALSYAGISRSEVFYEMIGADVESLECIKENLSNISTFTVDRQQDIISAASLYGG